MVTTPHIPTNELPMATATQAVSTNNCPASMGSPTTGCVYASNINADDGAWLTSPPAIVPFDSDNPFNVGSGTFYTGDSTDEGADGYVTYTMPDGSTAYNLTLENDVSTNGGSGNYIACSEASAQGSTYLCDPTWGLSPYEAAFTNASFYAAGSQFDTVLAVGKRCSATLTAGQTYDCTAAGQLPAATIPTGSGVDPGYDDNLAVGYTNVGADEVEVGYGSDFHDDCKADAGDTCVTYGEDSHMDQDVEMENDSDSTATVTIEVSMLAVGWYAPDEWPPAAPGGPSNAASASSASGTTSASASAVQPRVTGLAVKPPSGRGTGRIKFTTATAGTTALTVQRRSHDHWVSLPEATRSAPSRERAPGRRRSTGIWPSGAPRGPRASYCLRRSTGQRSQPAPTD